MSHTYKFNAASPSAKLLEAFQKPSTTGTVAFVPLLTSDTASSCSEIHVAATNITDNHDQEEASATVASVPRCKDGCVREPVLHVTKGEAGIVIGSLRAT